MMGPLRSVSNPANARLVSVPQGIGISVRDSRWREFALLNFQPRRGPHFSPV